MSYFECAFGLGRLLSYHVCPVASPIARRFIGSTNYGMFSG